MTIAALIARILLGLIFAGLGAIPFFIHRPPPQPGLAGEFNSIFYQSHWVQFVAGFLYNSYAFHITMLPIGLVAPILASVLWLLVALQYRDIFAPIFRAKPIALP